MAGIPIRIKRASAAAVRPASRPRTTAVVRSHRRQVAPGRRARKPTARRRRRRRDLERQSRRCATRAPAHRSGGRPACDRARRSHAMRDRAPGGGAVVGPRRRPAIGARPRAPTEWTAVSARRKCRCIGADEPRETLRRSRRLWVRSARSALQVRGFRRSVLRSGRRRSPSRWPSGWLASGWTMPAMSGGLVGEALALRLTISPPSISTGGGTEMPCGSVSMA